MIDISIIIVSYNTKSFLLKCLESIDRNKPKKYSYEVIVVDNNSKDDSGEMVKKDFLDIRLIENKENLGFSKANNIGVAQSKGRYVLFLNSDTEIEEDTIDTMVTFMDLHKDAGAATCAVLMPNGKIDDASHRGFPTPWNAFCYFSGLSKLIPYSMEFNGYNLAWKDLDKIHTIDALAGAFMIVRREVGNQVSWWDEDYFFYGEDLDFCYMLRQKGWKVYYVPTTKILHYKGVSGGIKGVSQEVTTASQETKKRATLARFNAMRIFYKKHYSPIYPSLVTWVVMNAIAIKLWLTLRKYT